MALCVEMLAIVATRQQQGERAARLFAIANALCDAANYHLSAGVIAFHEQAVAGVKAVPRPRFLPEEDRLHMTRGRFRDALAAALGGHAAEGVVFGEVSTGARDDIERATLIVRRMVTRFGMSDRLGPVAFGRKQQMIFLGRDIGGQRDYSGACWRNDRRGDTPTA